MICLYEKDETVFTDNGLCVLDPSSCVVNEVAGGQYELTMEHPLDDAGKYMMLTEERLIKAPVPKTVIPQITLPELKVIRTTEQTNLYSRIPTSRYANDNWRIIKTVYNNQAAYSWKIGAYYNAGAVVLWLGIVYRAGRGNYNIVPGTDLVAWFPLGSVTDFNPTVDGGTVIATLPADTLVYKTADVKGSYIKVSTTDSKTGYVLSSAIAETTERHSEIIPEQTITEQVFRIYSIESDDEAGNILVVRARHKSYDFARNSLYDCKVANASPAESIAAIQGNLMYDDNRVIACDITGATISKDWSFKNPVNALLDPEIGLLTALNARLIRNNDDFYLLDNSTPNQGISIEYGVNMLGVHWSRTVNGITRIVPRSGNSDKGYLYIDNGGRIQNGVVQDQGKNYVESEIADQYAKPIIYVLNCSYSVGQQYEEPDGTKANYTEQTVKAKMLEDALNMFVKDGADGVDITLDVEFILLGDTVEYRQYKNLQNVSLYDITKVKTGKSGIDASAKVTEYRYDSIRKRYISIKLGTINTFKKRIPGYRVVNESVTYEKLSPDLINRILTANASSSTDSGGGGGSSPGGDAQPIVANVVDNLTSTSTTNALSANQGRVLNEKIIPNSATDDGYVLKGGTNYGKVWKTDEQGNPAWRDDDSPYKVTESLTTNSSGYLTYDLAFEKFVTCNVSTATFNYAFARKAANGKTIIQIFDSSFNPVANATVSVDIWRIK